MKPTPLSASQSFDPSALPAVVFDLLESLQNAPSVERVILFGSRARGDYEERSDIDLAIDCPSASPQAWQEIQEIIENAKTLLKVEAVRLHTAPAALQHHILNEGILLYDRQG